jgi:hypothetical protein
MVMQPITKAFGIFKIIQINILSSLLTISYVNEFHNHHKMVIEWNSHITMFRLPL